MDDNVLIKMGEIRSKIEIELSDWMKLKVLNVQYIDKKYIVDLIDNDNYKYKVEYGVILRSRGRNLKLNRFFRNNIYTLNNIKNYLEIENKLFSLVSTEFTKAIDDLEWDCPIHGEFRVCWNSIKNGSGCPKCGRIQAGLSKRNTIEYVRSIFIENDLVLMTDMYNNNEEKLPFICNKHKDEGIQYISFGNLISGKGCIYCSKERYLKKVTKSHEQFISEVKTIHGDKYTVIGQYIGCKEYVEVYCNKCKNPFWIAPHHLLEGHGCGNCNKSLGENIIEQILLSKKLNFIKQYKFDDCIGLKRKLPFDFAIFDDDNNLKYLIEYNGIQHYKPVEIFGGIEAFKKQCVNDQIKLDYCKMSNINLIIIPYWDFKNIETILENKLIL
ncbi:MAG: hypothetical protein M0Q94_10480 [Candidatus Cloacimonetes bacterium]|nr:hypothetical protein [Candidatus Cloacimonadota bacterium]